MADTVTFEEVAALAAKLSRQDQQRLAESLSRSPCQGETRPRPQWTDIRGIAPDLLNGEDAQAWVRRMRDDDEEQRKKSLGPRA